MTTEILGVGPLSPPITGPGIKNRHLKDGMEKNGTNIYWINTLEINSGMVLDCVSSLYKYDKIIISASKKVRIFCATILAPRILTGDVHVVLLPMGGEFHEDIQNMPPGIRLFYSHLFSQFDVILPETDAMSRDINETLGPDSNVKTLPNLRPRPSEKPKTKIHNEQLKFVYVGRIKRTKGLSYLLEAFNNLPENTNASLDIYGHFLPNDAYKDEFLKLCSKNPDVEYNGMIPDGEVIETLSAYDVFIFPTYYQGEGFPGALIEALSAGCAVLATDWNYNDEIIEPGYNGKLVAPEDPDALRREITWMCENPNSVSDFKNNAWKGSEHYSIDHVVNDLESILSEFDWNLSDS